MSLMEHNSINFFPTISATEPEVKEISKQ